MSVKTHGPIRGFIGRWVMRFEASGQILSMGFQGTTAVSALSGVLAYTGYQRYVPWILVSGSLLAFVFAFAYVELGLYNRKNREKFDRGNNFAKPHHRIEGEMIVRGLHATREGRPLTTEEQEIIDEELDATYQRHRNGIHLD